MLYNPPSGEAGATVALPNVRDDYPRPAVTYDQSSVFTPPAHQAALPQVPQGPQIPIDPSLLDIPGNNMGHPNPNPNNNNGHMLIAPGPNPGANFHPSGAVSDYGGAQSAAMRSGNWQVVPGPSGTSRYPSPPELSYSHSSHATTSGELVASPTRSGYYNQPNGTAPDGTVTTSNDPTLGGLNTTTKPQSNQLEVTVSQQQSVVDDNGAGPSGHGSVSGDGNGFDLDCWTTDSYILDNQSTSLAGPSNYAGTFIESN